jgi:hypothetical protein
VNKRGDEPRSLLRRLLKQAEERSGTAEVQPPISARRTTGEASPVRPSAPESAAPPPQLTPRATQTQTIPKVLAGVEERLQAEEALAQLRQKTAQIANEFAEGKVNRAQFTAMYAHFNERRVIIERLLARDPNSQAWQQVARPGHTVFLRQHFEARPLSYAIFDHMNGENEEPLTSQGNVSLPPAIVKQIMTAIQVLRRNHDNSKPLGALRKPIDNGRWITVVPGKYTTSITLFSLEPSAQQFTLVQDLHRDFERANRVTLERGIRVPEQLVFPHRALFERAREEPS